MKKKIELVSLNDKQEIITLYQSYNREWTASVRVDVALENQYGAVARVNGKIVGFAYMFPIAPDIYELANIYRNQLPRTRFR